MENGATVPYVESDRRVKDKSGAAPVLIAGCGYVGSRLGEELAAEGHEVFGLRRRPGTLAAPIRPLVADLADRATLGALPDASFVVYAASADETSPEAYRRAYVDGLGNLLDALAGRGAKPRRLLYVSSTGVYPQGDGEWVDEATPCDPEHFSGRLLLEGERLAAAAPFPAVIVRFGGIYGPGRTRLVVSVRSGSATCNEDVWTNRIHRDDCAGVLRHLIAAEAPPPLLVAVDDEPASQCDVYRWIAARIGVPAPRAEPTDPERYGRRSNKRCRNTLLRASGYRFRYPTFREGYGALIDAGA